MADVNIVTVPVGNPGNAADTELMTDGTTGYGAVAYEYNIGKYEVTNAQYAAFLNAVAATDTHSLYNTIMGSYGGITRTGSSGSYSYTAISGRENRPVTHVSFWDAARFANWLHNGQGSGDTESGAYTLTADGIANNTVTRNADWKWAVTSENEWYKAAYHKNDGVTGNYYNYPTSSDTAPTAESPAGGSNSANYDWAIGNLTDVGAYTSSDSPYGTFDQGGNLWEWNEAVHISMLSHRGLRGSAWAYSEFDMRASYRASFMGSAGEGTNVGFRVSQVPVPGAAILGMIGIGMVGAYTRKRRVADATQ